MSKHIYHSALHAPLASAPLQRWEGHGSVALVHDAFNPLPAEFDRCDVLYAEPPWPRGFDVFKARVEAPVDLPYDAFVERLRDLAMTHAKPVVYVLAKSQLNKYAPDFAVRCSLWGGDAYAGFYRCSLGVPVIPDLTVEKLLGRLAERYDCIGDITAGYGNSGRIFAAAGKRFVLSDFDPRCIGKIAEIADGWYTSLAPGVPPAPKASQ